MRIYNIPFTRSCFAIFGFIIPILLLAPTASAQSRQAVQGAVAGLSVNGDLEEYLRYMQSLGKVPLMSCSFRGFSPQMVDSLVKISGPHPWQSSWQFQKGSKHMLHVLPADVTVRYNSRYPYSINEGPVWTGRGITTAISGGMSGTWGPMSLVVKPTIFRAENKRFPLQSTGVTGRGIFFNPLFPKNIDLPQRFGDDAYTHFAMGETTLRVDGYGLSAGATTANEWWGPASVFPYIVGNNAAGVPRVFVGTEHPLGIGIGKLQVRLEYGLEFQSKYSPVVGPDTFTSIDSSGTKRFMSGLVMTFSPAGIPGLEIGTGRYFHDTWRGHVTTNNLRSPFEGLLIASSGVGGPAGIDSGSISNQLASIWARWIFPRSGLELYGEYGHEDHNIDGRDLYSELDHSRTTMLGIRKAFGGTAARMDGIRFEVFDGTASTVSRHRGEGLIYIHFPLRQGHTQEGKLIGSPAGIGSPAAAIVAWDRVRQAGKLTTYLLRTTENVYISNTIPNSPHTSVTVGANGFRMEQFGDILFGLAATYSMRTTRDDGLNVNVMIGMRSHAF